jgi:hypothetical protein
VFNSSASPGVRIVEVRMSSPLENMFATIDELLRARSCSGVAHEHDNIAATTNSSRTATRICTT